MSAIVFIPPFKDLDVDIKSLLAVNKISSHVVRTKISLLFTARVFITHYKEERCTDLLDVSRRKKPPTRVSSGQHPLQYCDAPIGQGCLPLRLGTNCTHI